MARRLLSRTMASLTRQMQPITRTAEGAVAISYPTLVSSPLSLRDAIDEAFGSHPKSLGIIIVRDLPLEYSAHRERLLKLAYQFAQLLEDVREKYTHPASRYSFGWSHGKVWKHFNLKSSSLKWVVCDDEGNYEWEARSGGPLFYVGRSVVNLSGFLMADTLKGSYYANPVVDKPSLSQSEQEKYPEYYGQNIWPRADEGGIEGFESAFKNLGRFVFNVGCQLAAACQPFALSHLSDSSMSLPELISSSQTTKARLLHYFPPSPEESISKEDEPIDSWCGFHLDHSLLTGLCSAMFLRKGSNGEPTVVSSPSPSSGLYIRTRGGDLTKVSIPVDCLAFQTGEALEVATGGKLRATPHCVRVGASGSDAVNISRQTFALFMQPNTDQLLSPVQTFGQFSKGVFDEHYSAETM
ncbi:hypothetical protein D9756_004042 [Leucocoprinus leucothites]|uniref:Clavaminate synthase-like protein n=1 Tax=Leucocoprinus leucothites TaxID=201217 RepID=A0A8H5FZT3_9AGAR|nr:hypothetical protein D9756_004042 [Leucoagaricus leucothites]